MSPNPKPLNVAIVGAGLGGLTAAIALRRQGHLVKVFETSRLDKEIGAAIVVSPNAMRVLEVLGYALENLRSSEYRGIVFYDANGGEGKTALFKDQAKHYGRQGLSCHRSALHEELKRLALAEEGEGTPVNVHLETKIIDCDPDVGKLTTKTGDEFHADVVIAADGIHSTLRTVVVGHPIVAPATGLCAFRWTLDASKLDGRTELDWVLKDGISGGRLGYSNGRNMFMYPCKDATLINVSMVHPDKRDQDQSSSYARVTKEDVLEEYKEFGPQFQAVLEMTTDPINLWQIRAMPRLPTYSKGRLALLGDSAHATFPTLGQGVAMAIEDAGALGCMLPFGTTPEEVPSRLAAYQEVRKERDEFVNTESVEQVTVPSKQGLLYHSEEMQDLLNSYDAIAVAQEHFNKTFSKS